jgi:SagB-type dehydrogenase family enzyme
VYRYIPERHTLTRILEGDLREKLAASALNQPVVKNAAIDLVIAGVYSRTTGKYGDRGIRFVHLEAGHAAQNVCLQVTALKLGTVTIGAFNDDQVRTAVGISADGTPLYIIPIGKPKN